MKILKQIDADTRIVYKRFSIRYLGSVILLQRKRKWFWESVAWTYPSVFKDDTADSIEGYLFWSEKRNNNICQDDVFRKFGL